MASKQTRRIMLLVVVVALFVPRSALAQTPIYLPLVSGPHREATVADALAPDNAPELDVAPIEPEEPEGLNFEALEPEEQEVVDFDGPEPAEYSEQELQALEPNTPPELESTLLDEVMLGAEEAAQSKNVAPSAPDPFAVTADAQATSRGAASQRIFGDFNNDGFDDLAVGAPGESVGSAENAGMVHVFYGSVNGLTATNDQAWHQNTSGILGTSEANDYFGWTLAVGNFNGDSYADLAIGVIGERLGTSGYAGAVSIIYGSASGLTATGNQLWHQNSTGVADSVESNDYFGSSLAAGDFNNNGRDDLIIGVAYEDRNSNVDVGMIHILYGSAAGLSATGSQNFYLASGAAGDRYGYNVTAGDFNGDGRDDLVTSSPNRDVSGISDAGALFVLYGSASGITVTGQQSWNQNSPNVASSAEAGDVFGEALATGDFNNDNRDDLAIGAAGEDVGSVANAGYVQFLFGSTTGLRATGAAGWHQDTPGIAGVAEAGDLFGSSLVSADFNGDGRDDLAVGADAEDIGSIANAGMAHVFYNSSSGLQITGNQSWHQSTPSVAGSPESNERFAFSLSAGDFNNDGRHDLVIGVPYEGIGSFAQAGMIHVLRGSSSGLTATGSQTWHQDSSGVAGTVEAGDSFGFAVN